MHSRRNLLWYAALLCVVPWWCYAENEAAIKEFGIEKGKPVWGAFFFFDYRYVEAPYVVERRGLDLFVNGILFEAGPGWPQEDLTEKQDPGDPPAGAIPFKNDGLYFERKWRYLSGKYDLRQAQRLMYDVLKGASGVSEVRWNGRDRFYIKGKDGYEVPRVFDADWKDEMVTRAQALEIAKGSMQGLEEKLGSRNSGYWRCSTGLGVGLTARHNARALELLLSRLTPDEKIKKAKELGLDLVVEHPRMVTEPNESQQLAKRFERLKKGQSDDDLNPGPPIAPGNGAKSGPPSAANYTAHSASFPYAWLGAGLAFAALVAALLLWRLRRR